MQRLWPKLMTEKEDVAIYKSLQSELQQLDSKIAGGRAALALLEAQLMQAACDDPGAHILDQVVRPLLQQRLIARSKEFYASHRVSLCKPLVQYSVAHA